MDVAMIDQSTPGLTTEQTALVTDILDFAGKYLGLPADTEMSVTFMHNDEIQRYNREYRDKDRATDVISFAIEDDDEDMPLMFDEDMQADLAKNLGDILVSVDKVAEQAKEYEHSYDRELGFLVVHGFLHLNGYDHTLSEADEKEMFGLQTEILDQYGLER